MPGHGYQQKLQSLPASSAPGEREEGWEKFCKEAVSKWDQE